MFTGHFEKLHSNSQVWCSWNVPKHSFILWLAMHNRLATKDRMSRFNTTIDLYCSLCCDDPETRDDLFFCCSWVRKCLLSLKNWLDWRYGSAELEKLLRWIQRSRVSRFKKSVYIACIAALVYAVWTARNKKIWKNEDTFEDMVIKHIKYSVKKKFLGVYCKKKNGDD